MDVVRQAAVEHARAIPDPQDAPATDRSGGLGAARFDADDAVVATQQPLAAVFGGGDGTDEADFLGPCHEHRDW